MSASFRCGLVPSLRLAASQSLVEQVDRLARFQPTLIGAYPSALEQLVGAAEDGVLVIHPELIFTGGETVTPALRRRVREVWNAEIFDFYGLTETLIIAGECGAHQGMHLYDDLVVLEVVDEDGRHVPPGERGAGVYVTSLINHTLPIIRYAVTDLMTVTDEPCPCGAPFRRIVAVEGRREEMIDLRRRTGGTVRVHPFVIEAPLEEMAEVRRFRLSGDGTGGVRIVVVPSDVVPVGEQADGAARAAGIAPAVRERVHHRVVAALASQGVAPECVTVETADAIDARRGPTDKLVRTPGER
jgi:phenylacetate-coenzyme A ligase PaaK-like adenylate-forming protein